MKIKLIGWLITVGLAGVAGATTITASGGTTGAQFVTTAGTLLTGTNASILVGSMSGNIFTQFALADATPPAFGTSATLLGRWLGNAADASNATASAFNGLQIWFKVTTTANGGGVGYFGSSLNFPTANAGVGDALNVAGSTLNTFNSTLSTVGGTAAFQAANVTYPNGFVTIATVPEPSAALLGAIGALGLLRRRRI